MFQIQINVAVSVLEVSGHTAEMRKIINSCEINHHHRLPLKDNLVQPI